MNCKNCNKQLNNPKALFCSDKCRMAFKRVNNPNITRTEKPEQAISNNPNKMSAKEIYDAINICPEDTWRESLEYAELMRRLSTWTKEKLQETGHWIPNRLNGVKIRK